MTKAGNVCHAAQTGARKKTMDRQGLDVHEWFSIAWKVGEIDHYVDFQIHEISCHAADGPHYMDQRLTCPAAADSATPVDGGELLAGSLKRDGCMNVAQPAGSAMLHFCGPEADPVIGQMMRAVYAIGQRLRWWDAAGNLT